MLKELSFSTSKSKEIVDITKKISNIIVESKVQEGICIIHCPHTTAGLTINENVDPDVQKDIINKLSELIPKEGNFKHSEGNSDAHIFSSLLGSEKTIIIKDNNPLLGTWQGIYLFEGDGPRTRKIIIKIIKG